MNYLTCPLDLCLYDAYEVIESLKQEDSNKKKKLESVSHAKQPFNEIFIFLLVLIVQRTS